MSIGSVYWDEEIIRRRDRDDSAEMREKIRRAGYFTKEELLARGYSQRNGIYMVAKDKQKPERFALSGVCFEDEIPRYRALAKST